MHLLQKGFKESSATEKLLREEKHRKQPLLNLLNLEPIVRGVLASKPQTDQPFTLTTLGSVFTQMNFLSGFTSR